jgi:nucleotide-binding universal stress UspA family protein
VDPNLFKTILVPVDFSPCSQEAFYIGLQLAQVYQAKVLLLHVIDTKALDTLNNLGLTLPSQRKHQLKKLRHHARTQARQLLQGEAAKKLRIQRFLSEGKPFVEIVRLARSEKVDLIVMGSYGGQTGDVARIFFGSTAEQVVRTANCAVLCVPFPLAKASDSRGTSFRKGTK